MSSFVSVLLIFSISIVSSLNDPKCGRLSNGCELKSYYCNDFLLRSKCHMYICDRIDLNFQFDLSEIELIQNCSSSNPEVIEALNSVYFRLSKSSILDGPLNLLNNELFMNGFLNITYLYAEYYEGLINIKSILKYRYIKTIDVGVFKQRNVSIRWEFYYSNFDFNFNRSRIRSCDNNLENLDEIHYYVFDQFLPICEC